MPRIESKPFKFVKSDINEESDLFKQQQQTQVVSIGLFCSQIVHFCTMVYMRLH